MFVDVPGVVFDGLVQITDVADAPPVSVAEFPEIGSEIEAVVLGFKEHNRQIWLGTKPSQLAGAE